MRKEILTSKPPPHRLRSVLPDNPQGHGHYDVANRSRDEQGEGYGLLASLFSAPHERCCDAASPQLAPRMYLNIYGLH